MNKNNQSTDIRAFVDLLNDDSGGLDCFLNKLDVLLHNNANLPKTDTKNIDNYLFILNDLEKIEKFNDVEIYIAETFDTLKIVSRDLFDNEQFIKIKYDIRGKFRVHSHSLPDAEEFSGEFDDASSVINQFLDYMTELEDYMEVMKSIDRECWVTDPVFPTFKDTYRRIVLSDDVNILVTVDAKFSNMLPQIKLLGPTEKTNPLLIKLNENTAEWNPDDLFIANLLLMFDLSEFPCKIDVDVGCAQTENDCSICYMRLDENGLLPTVTCERKTCSHLYHQNCLYQWLDAVSNKLQRLNTIHGECPSCSADITCLINE